MSEEEYEKFEITDYDLNNEFNLNRPRRNLTKNQQIYGIWADDSDQDSGEDSNKRSRHEKKSKNYTAPVSFVAGGVQQSGKKKTDDLTKTDKSKSNGTKDEEINISQSFHEKKQSELSNSPEYSGSSSNEEEASRPTFSSRNNTFVHKSHIDSKKNMGAWEQHTRGIGAKLLLQMGFQPGKGLGKNLQGISQPVEAHVRKGRGAIGAYGPETTANVPAKNLKKIGNDSRDLKDLKDMKKWKKGTDTGVDRNKHYYKSVEEVIEKGKKCIYILSDKISKKLTNVPVIDMTGPEKRVLNGYHNIAQVKMQNEDFYDSDMSASTKTIHFALPELMHNLQLIVDMCVQDIISIDKTNRELSEKKEATKYELKNLNEIVVLEKNHIKTLENALELINELTSGNESLNLERAEKIFLQLQHNFAAEYSQFNLADLAAGVIAPLLKSSLEDWQPLKQPTRHIDIIKRWRTILDPNNSTNAASDARYESRNVFDPYSSLIWVGVMPSFRASASLWNPKNHQPMAALLDCWAPIFPAWILDSVLEQLVLTRLCTGVREWDPLTDTIPIHIWILPWSSILGNKMEEFAYPTIREKLGLALQAWIPQDRSARAMLTPWKNSFEKGEMQIFLSKHIIPKLQLVLNDFIICPMQQDLELWNQVWEWHEILPTILMSQLLDKYFFPKWMQVLAIWLNQSPDFAEISRWYSGWKNIFPEELLRETCIKEHFRRALEMMHRATETVAAAGYSGMPSAAPSLPTMANTITATSSISTAPINYLDMQQMISSVQLDFKELVLQKCAERGILFAPMPGRRELGKQIYRIGKLYCYIDRNVCMLSDSSFQNWMPTSLAQLLESASTGNN